MSDPLDAVGRRLAAERFAPPIRPCGKIRWASERLARNYGRLLELRYADGVARDAYQCGDCGGDWHVTRVRQEREEASNE